MRICDTLSSMLWIHNWDVDSFVFTLQKSEQPSFPNIGQNLHLPPTTSVGQLLEQHQVYPANLHNGDGLPSAPKGGALRL